MTSGPNEESLSRSQVPDAAPYGGFSDFTVTGGQGHVIGNNTQVHQDFSYHEHHHPKLETTQWPIRIGRPPLLADSFQDRPSLREQVASVFAAGHTAVVTQLPAQVLTGDGGVGKSQLAVQIWLTHTRPSSGTSEKPDTQPVDLALWVTASSRSSIQMAYALATKALGLGGAFDNDNNEAAAQAFLDWLAGTDRSWLIILDDLADPADLARLWPPEPSSSLNAHSVRRLLVTTRRRDPTLFGRGRQRVDVALFSPQEALHYLNRRLKPRRSSDASDELEAIASLASDLGFLPIALAQASAYIMNEKITVQDYRILLNDRQARLAELMPADPGDDHSPDRTVAATWSLAIERANAMPPEGAASRLAELIAVLDANGIPETVLTSQAARIYAHLSEDSSRPPWAPWKPRTRPSLTPEQARRALLNLDRLSIITHDSATSARTVRMHALAQRATREDPSQTHETISSTQRAKVAADALLESWPSVERNKDLAQALRANVTALQQIAGDGLWLPEGHPLLWRAGNSLGEAGLVHLAIQHWKEMYESSVRVLGADHPDSLTTRSNLARCQGQAGDPAGAVSAYQALLTDQLRILGADHPQTLATRHNLANWRGQAGDPFGAVQALIALLAERERVLGPDNPDTLTTRHNLARFRGQAGDPEAAVEALTGLLADRKRVLGPDHPDTLATRHNVAYWQGQAGDPSGAVTSFTSLLSDSTRVLGDEHPDTLIIRHNLAHWQGEAGDRDGAVSSLRIVHGIQLRVLGADHPHSKATDRELKHWVSHSRQPLWFPESSRINRLPRRKPMMTRASPGAAGSLESLLAYLQATAGHDHADTFAIRGEIARTFVESGNAREAVVAFASLLADSTRVWGSDHPDTLMIRHNLARSRANAGDRQGAVIAFQALLEEQLKALGPEHPHTKKTDRELKFWSWQASNSRVVHAFRVRSLSVREKAEPNIFFQRRAELTVEDSKPAAALETLLHYQQRILGPSHFDTLTTRYQIARSRGHSGDSAGAVAAYETLLIDQKRAYGRNHPDTFATRHEIAYWRGQLGDAVGAAAAYEALLADQERALGPEHPSTFTTRHEIAFWRGSLGDPSGAERDFEKLLADQQRVFGPVHPTTQIISEGLSYWRAETARLRTRSHDGE